MSAALSPALSPALPPLAAGDTEAGGHRQRQPSPPLRNGSTGVAGAIAALRAGRPILLVDDLGPFPEGDLVFAASAATSALVAFMVRHTSGFVQVAVSGRRTDRLDLPPMTPSWGTGPATTPYATSVDAADVGTGISAADRARTIALLADETAGPDSFTRPGHVVVYRAHEHGVLGRAAKDEAALDLVRLSGNGAAVAYAGLVSDRDPTRMARAAELAEFAADHGLPMITASAVVAHRLQLAAAGSDRAGVQTSELVLHHKPFRLLRWTDGTDETLALVLGPASDTPVRVYEECLSELFDPTGCACRSELAAAVRSIAVEGRGLLLYRRRSVAGIPHPTAVPAGGHLAPSASRVPGQNALRVPTPFGP